MAGRFRLQLGMFVVAGALVVAGLVTPPAVAEIGTSGEAREDALREAGNVMAEHESDEPVDLPEATVTPEDVFAWRAEGNRRAPRVAQELGMSPDEVLEAYDATVFPEGQGTVSSDATVVISYKRTYAGLPVVGGSFGVHTTRSGEIRWTSRNAVPIRVPTTRPTVARRSAMDAAVASTQLKAPQPRAPELVVFVHSREGQAVLAWRTVIVGRGPGGGEEVLTDAGTGAVVGRAPTGLEFDPASEPDGGDAGEVSLQAAVSSGGISVDAVGHSLYSGKVGIRVTRVETNPGVTEYELRDGTRGQHYTVNFSTGQDRIVRSVDNVWGDGTSNNPETIAVDAHYGAAGFWDYFKDVHGRDGIRNDSLHAYSRVHAGGSDATWKTPCADSQRAGCVEYGGSGLLPPVSVDIVGHEMTHGIALYRGLNPFNGETRAIIESTSDIFGAAVEFHVGNPLNPGNYLLGEQPGGGVPKRRMDNPAATGGIRCYSDIGSISDPYKKAGVGNLFFYLLAEGSGQKTINGIVHNASTCNQSSVTGIGRATAARIWYRALNTSMFGIINYIDARDSTVLASRGLYGAGSVQCQTVMKAWDAVGVPVGTETCGSAGPPGTAGPNAQLNSMFNDYGNGAGCADWSGADGTQSIRLPSGKRAWFFSDTYLGAVGERPGFFRSFISNSIVIQSGSGLRTITGGNTCQERNMSISFWDRYANTPVKDSTAFTWYWSGDGKVIGSNVVKFYFRNVNHPTDRWIEDRTGIATIPISSLENNTVMNIQPTLMTPQQRPYGDHPIIWGTALLDEGSYTYIYGWAVNDAWKSKKLYVARVQPAYLANPSQWQYNTGGGQNSWSAKGNEAAARPVANDLYVEAGFSVAKFNDTYWLIQHEPNLNGGDIVAHPASQPWRFTSNRISLYRPPEGARRAPAFHFYYETRMHAGLGGSTNVVLSYNVNTSAVSVGCKTRADHDGNSYRPRFINVPISAFDPSGATASTRVALHAQVDVGTDKFVPPQDGRGLRRSQVELPDDVTILYDSDSTFGGQSGLSVQSIGDMNWYDSWALQASGGCPVLNQATSLSATAQPTGWISLDWSLYGRDIWYWIYRRNVTKGQSFQRGELWATTSPTNFWAVLQQADNNNEWEFYVLPFPTGNSGAVAPQSNVVRRTARVEPPAAPAQAYYRHVDENTALVSWTRVTYPSENVYYRVRACNMTLQCEEVSFIDHDKFAVTIRRNSWYEVRAENVGGNSSWTRATPEPAR